MSSDIWVAVIALIGTLTGSFGGIIIANRLVNFRLDRLEEEVKKLNALSERVAVTERDVAAMTDALGGLRYAATTIKGGTQPPQ